MPGVSPASKTRTSPSSVPRKTSPAFTIYYDYYCYCHHYYCHYCYYYYYYYYY